MRLYSRFSFRFCLITLLIIVMFFLTSVFLVPPLLKNAYLLSPKTNMLNSAELIRLSLNEDNTDEVFSGLSGDEDFRLTLISPSLTVTADTSERDNIEGKFLIVPGTEQALSGESVFYSYSEKNAFVFTVLCPVEKDGETHLLYLRHTDRELASAFARDRLVCIYSGILLLLIPIILLLYNIYDLNKRMNNLTSAISQLTSSKNITVLPLSGDDEISNASRLLADYSLLQKQTEELRRRFVSDASHELKTPLAAVKLLSDTILLTPQMSHDDVCEFLTDISNEIDRLTRICSNLLRMTQYDTISDSAELNPLELSIVAENVSRILSHPAKSAGLELRCELQSNCFVRANYDLVFQVIYNLIENAIKYGSDGKEVRVFLYRKQDSVIFIVDDDGNGIPIEDLERIFDRFYRVDKARSRATGGTGLGLSIVHSAVQTCGGTVEAQNREPKGARFIVRFPACNPPEDCDFGGDTP